MRKNDKKLFLNKESLYTMINLRINGFAISSLALLFNCDPSSIRNQCDRYEIVPLDDIYTIERIIHKTFPKPSESRWKIVDGERINLGKSYKEYLNKR